MVAKAGIRNDPIHASRRTVGTEAPPSDWGYRAPSAMVQTPWGDARKLSSSVLRPGPGIPREEVARNRRERLFAATVISVAERGYEATTVAHLTEIAHMSRGAFYEQFRSKHDCFMATVDEITAQGRAATAHAFTSHEGSWEERLRAALETVVAVVAAYPETARLCYVDAYTAGPEATARAESSLEVFAEMAQVGIAASPERTEVPPEVVHAVLGGLHVVIEDHLRRDAAGELPNRVPALWRWALSYQSPAEPLSRPRRRLRSAGVARRIELDADERILRATAETVTEQGYVATTVADIVRAASVSLSTFYAHFDSKEDAFLATLEQGRAQGLAATLPAFQRAPDWQRSVRGGLRALFSFLAVETAWAGVAAEVRAAGTRATEHAQQTMRMFGDLLAPGEAAAGGTPSVMRAAIGGAIYTLAIDEVRVGRAARLPELLPVATFIALAPYVGVEEATAVANDDGRGRAERGA